MQNGHFNGLSYGLVIMHHSCCREVDSFIEFLCLLLLSIFVFKRENKERKANEIIFLTLMLYRGWLLCIIIVAEKVDSLTVCLLFNF